MLKYWIFQTTLIRFILEKELETQLLKSLNCYTYRTIDGSFKWKLIEARLKTNKDEGKLRDKRYQIVVVAIFWLVFFLSKAVNNINVKATNAFIGYKQTRTSLLQLSWSRLSYYWTIVGYIKEVQCNVVFLYYSYEWQAIWKL